MNDINEVTIVGVVSSKVSLGRTRQECDACHFVIESKRGKRMMISPFISLSMMARVNCYDELVAVARKLLPGSRVFVRGELMNRKLIPRSGESEGLWLTEVKALLIERIDSSEESPKPNDDVKGDADDQESAG